MKRKICGTTFLQVKVYRNVKYFIIQLVYFQHFKSKIILKLTPSVQNIENIEKNNVRFTKITKNVAFIKCVIG